jgi:hypothetical protein
MNEDAIIARLAGLEVLAASCFTFLLASSGHDPDLSKAKAILDVVKSEAESGLAHLPEKIGTEAKAYLSDVIDKVLTNLTALRGGPSTRQ